MKKYNKIIIISLLLLIYVYVCSYAFISNNYIIFEGENLNFRTLFGIELRQVSSTNPNLENLEKYETQQTSTTITESQTGTINLSLKLLDRFNLKKISVNVIPKTTVIPVGNIIGLKLYTKGVLVVRYV